jgi:hypothetical protein
VTTPPVWSDELFGTHHVIATRVVNSRSSLRRAVQVEKLPAPLRLPKRHDGLVRQIIGGVSRQPRASGG